MPFQCPVQANNSFFQPEVVTCIPIKTAVCGTISICDVVFDNKAITREKSFCRLGHYRITSDTIEAIPRGKSLGLTGFKLRSPM